LHNLAQKAKAKAKGTGTGTGMQGLYPPTTPLENTMKINQLSGVS